MRSVTALKISLVTFIALKCAFMMSCVLQLRLIARAPVLLAEARANDLRQQTLAYAGLAVFIAALVVYFVWLYREKKRSMELGAAGVQYSAGLSVGCHFIPFANLYMPYQAMTELWRASLNPVEWKSQRLSPVVGSWWALWLINGIFGYIVFFSAKAGTGLDHLRLVTYLLILSAGLAVAANSVLLWMASRISKGLDISSEIRRSGVPPILAPRPPAPGGI